MAGPQGSIQKMDMASWFDKLIRKCLEHFPGGLCASRERILWFQKVYGKMAFWYHYLRLQ